MTNDKNKMKVPHTWLLNALHKRCKFSYTEKLLRIESQKAKTRSENARYVPTKRLLGRRNLRVQPWFRWYMLLSNYLVRRGAIIGNSLEIVGQGR